MLEVCTVSVEAEERKMKIKVEIKPASPATESTDNVNDIRSLVRRLNISATPTVCSRCCDSNTE